MTYKESEKKRINKSVGSMTTGTGLVNSKGYQSTFILHFGCNACGWRDTLMCPHQLGYPNQHANRICSQRALYIKKVFEVADTETRVLQVDEAVRLRLLLDKLTHDLNTESDLSPELAKLSKNLITHLDKMRRQDEGIKMHGEMDVTVKDFRKVVDEQAKALNGKNILEAEYDLNKPDNSEGQGEPGEEV